MYRPKKWWDTKAISLSSTPQLLICRPQVMLLQCCGLWFSRYSDRTAKLGFCRELYTPLAQQPGNLHYLKLFKVNEDDPCSLITLRWRLSLLVPSQTRLRVLVKDDDNAWEIDLRLETKYLIQNIYDKNSLSGSYYNMILWVVNVIGLPLACRGWNEAAMRGPHALFFLVEIRHPGLPTKP